MENRTNALIEVCGAISMGDFAGAAGTLRRDYPFLPAAISTRRYGPAESTRVFIRDGFVDRYSGSHLVFPGALRLISHVLPAEFPYQANWRSDLTHPAYWELTATVDHLVPVSRGGADTETNWVTTSMLRNSAKGNWTIEELGWTLHPAGAMKDWNGLLEWFVTTYQTLDRKQLPAGLSHWYRAARAASQL